MKRKNCLSFL